MIVDITITKEELREKARGCGFKEEEIEKGFGGNREKLREMMRVVALTHKVELITNDPEESAER